MERILLDTDTAGDDTIAILMAVRAKNAKLEGITINCGNIQFDQEVENALYTLQMAGESGKVPVYPGARRPLMKGWKTVEDIHGPDGMGGARFPRADQRPEKKHAVDAIVDAVNGSPGELTLVEIAPMTNMALALRRDPGIAKKVKHFYFMGGSNQYLGNVTPAAEFNIWVDPDAASVVLNSGMPTTMVGWEICMRHGVLRTAELDEIERMKTAESDFFTAVNRQVRKFTSVQRGEDSISCPDSITMAIVLDPKVATETRSLFVEVDDSQGISRGATWVDERGVLGRAPNADVVYSASEGRFREMLYSLLRGERV